MDDKYYITVLDQAIFECNFLYKQINETIEIFYINSFQGKSCSFKPAIMLSLKSYSRDTKFGVAKASSAKARAKKWVIRQNARFISS